MTSGCAKSNSSESLHLQQGGPGQPGQTGSSQPRTASIRSRPTSSRITAAELEVSPPPCIPLAGGPLGAVR